MKQNITVEQFNELSIKGAERYREWAIPRNYYFVGIKTNSLPSIGQMIEFLVKNRDEGPYMSELIVEHIIYGSNVKKNHCQVGWNGELCDALWEAVKEVLTHKPI